MVNGNNDQVIKDLEAKRVQAMMSYKFDEAIEIQHQISAIKGSFGSNTNIVVEQSAPVPNPAPAPAPIAPSTPVVQVTPVSSPTPPQTIPSHSSLSSDAEKKFFNQLEELDQVFVKNILLRGGIIHKKIDAVLPDQQYSNYLHYVYEILNLCKKQKDEKSNYFYLGLNSDGIKNYLLNLELEQLDDIIKIFTYMRETTQHIKDIYVGMDISIKNYEGKEFLQYYNQQKPDQTALSAEDMKSFFYTISTKLFYFENLYSNIISLTETAKLISLQK